MSRMSGNYKPSDHEIDDRSWLRFCWVMIEVKLVVIVLSACDLVDVRSIKTMSGNDKL